MEGSPKTNEALVVEEIRLLMNSIKNISGVEWYKDFDGIDFNNDDKRFTLEQLENIRKKLEEIRNLELESQRR